MLLSETVLLQVLAGVINAMARRRAATWRKRAQFSALTAIASAEHRSLSSIAGVSVVICWISTMKAVDAVVTGT